MSEARPDLPRLFAVSSVAFTVAKYAGALYLVYLGAGAACTAGRDRPASRAMPATSRRVFTDGFLVALLNPKTTLFFAAFLPQFMGTASPTVAQAVLGALFVGVAATSDTCTRSRRHGRPGRFALRRVARRRAILLGQRFLRTRSLHRVQRPARREQGPQDPRRVDHVIRSSHAL